MRTIIKQKGVNLSEEKLGHLSNSTFLSLWSYQNIYRDQKGTKEIVDAIIVFGSDIILISDKLCAFPVADDIQISWARWYKRAIEASVRQIYGAERWLREHPDRIFLDQKCEHKFPSTCDLTCCHVHRVVVARGAVPASKAYFRGQGGLAIDTSIEGDVHLTSGTASPFHIGKIFPDKPFVHVFDELGIEDVFKQNDTARDAIAYLRSREEFLSRHFAVSAQHERDLVATYLRGYRRLPEAENFDHIIIQEGSFFDLMRGPAFLVRKAQDVVSYGIDHMIEHFAEYILDGTADTSADGFEPNEVAVRGLAETSRYERRCLAEGFTKFNRKTRLDKFPTK